MQLLSNSIANKYLEVFARVQNVINELVKKSGDNEIIVEPSRNDISESKIDDDAKSEVQFLTIRDLDTGLLTIKNLDTGDAQSISENDATFDFNAFVLNPGRFIMNNLIPV